MARYADDRAVPVPCRFSAGRDRGPAPRFGAFTGRSARSRWASPSPHESIEVYLFHDANTYARYLRRYFPDVPYRRAVHEGPRSGRVFAYWSRDFEVDLRHEVTARAVARGLALGAAVAGRRTGGVLRGTAGRGGPTAVPACRRCASGPGWAWSPIWPSWIAKTAWPKWGGRIPRRLGLGSLHAQRSARGASGTGRLRGQPRPTAAHAAVGCDWPPGCLTLAARICNTTGKKIRNTKHEIRNKSGKKKLKGPKLCAAARILALCILITGSRLKSAPRSSHAETRRTRRAKQSRSPTAAGLTRDVRLVRTPPHTLALAIAVTVHSVCRDVANG